MATQQGIDLCSFFIFNSTFGPKEGEEEKKVIYYHPSSADLNDQIKDVGLVEALVQFTRTFNCDAPLLSMQTLKQKHFFLEPEKDFFMTLVVRLPVIQLAKADAPYPEYAPESVQQPVYLSLLRHMYRLYRLLRGTMTAQTREQLQHSTAAIFDSYIPRLRLQQQDLLDIYGGVKFLPLDRLPFLKLQSFVNQLEVQHPFIRHMVIYYKQHLVWSGLGRTNMGIIGGYLETVLFPECGQTLPAVWKDRAAPTSGVFMSTEASGEGPDSFLAPPVVHLRKHNCTALPLGGADGTSRDGDDSLEGTECSEEADERAQMVIYRLRDVLLVLMVDVDVRLTLPLCRELDASMAGQVQELAALLARPVTGGAQTNREEADTKVIYYNRCNQAVKSSLHGPTGAPAVPQDALRLTVDLREDAFSFRSDGGAIFGRAMNESWVAGRVNPDREFFSVVQQKNMNLMDVNNEVEQLCRDQFRTIFFPV